MSVPARKNARLRELQCLKLTQDRLVVALGLPLSSLHAVLQIRLYRQLAVSARHGKVLTADKLFRMKYLSGKWCTKKLEFVLA